MSHTKSPHRRTGRRRGAPLGNTNHLIHGGYARHISVELRPDIATMPQDQNLDELALARSRLLACLEKQKNASPAEWLFYEHAISMYIRDITRLTHSNAVLGKDHKSQLDTVLEMMRQVNARQHVT